jgi:hypothetical protein
MGLPQHPVHDSKAKSAQHGQQVHSYVLVRSRGACPYHAYVHAASHRTAPHAARRMNESKTYPMTEDRGPKGMESNKPILNDDSLRTTRTIKLTNHLSFG